MKRDDKEADKALAPLIQLAVKTPGTIARVTERLTKLMGTKVHRQLVEKWLHPEIEKRTQPRFGTGLLLVKVRDEMLNTKTITIQNDENGKT